METLKLQIVLGLLKQSMDSAYNTATQSLHCFVSGTQLWGNSDHNLGSQILLLVTGVWYWVTIVTILHWTWLLFSWALYTHNYGTGFPYTDTDIQCMWFMFTGHFLAIFTSFSLFTQCFDQSLFLSKLLFNTGEQS